MEISFKNEINEDHYENIDCKQKLNLKGEELTKIIMRILVIKMSKFKRIRINKAA